MEQSPLGFFPDEPKIEKSLAWQRYIWMYRNREICYEIDHSEKYWPLVLSKPIKEQSPLVLFFSRRTKKRKDGSECTALEMSFIV